MRTTIAFLFFFVAASFGAVPVLAAKDTVVPVAPGNKAMDAAIAKARGSIAEFWRQHAKPDPGVEFLALKVRISDGKATEYFWLIEIQRKGAAHSGIINNDPNRVTKVKLGQRYSFKEADISDWTYMRNGRIVGNETLRVLLDMMPPEDAAKYRTMFEKP